MKLLKLILKSLLAIALIVLILWVAAIGILQTDKGQQWLLQRIVSYIEQETGARVEVGKIELVTPFKLRMHRLAFRKESALALTIQQLDFSCASPQLLLGGRIICSDIHVQGVDIDGEKSKEDSSFEMDWEHPLPIYVKIENLFIEHLRLSPRLIDSLVERPDLAAFLKAETFDIKGYVSHNPRKPFISAHLLIATNDFPLQLVLDTQNQQLSFSLHCRQAPLDRWHSEFLAQTHGNLACYAAASLETWRSLLDGSQKLAGEIEGSFKGFFDTKQEGTPLSAILDKGTGIKGKYRLSSKERLHIYDGQIENASFSLNSQFVLTKDFLIDTGRIAGEIRQLDNFQAFLPIEARGSMAFTGNLAGPIAAPSMNLKLTSPSLQIQEAHLQDTTTAIQGFIDGLTFNGEILAQGASLWVRDCFVQDFEAHLAGKIDTNAFQGEMHLQSGLFQTPDSLLEKTHASFKGEIQKNKALGDFQLTSDYCQAKEFVCKQLEVISTGSFYDQLFEGDLIVKSFAFYQQEKAFDHVYAIFTGAIHKTFVKGDLNLDLAYQQEPYHLATVFEWQKDQWLRLPLLSLEGLNTSLSGHLDIALPNFGSQGQLDYQIQDMQKISSLFFAEPIQGQAKGHLSLVPLESGKQELSLECQGQHMQGTGWQAETVSLKAYAADQWSQFLKGSRLLSEIELRQVQYAKGKAYHLYIKSDQLLNIETLSATEISAHIQGQNVEWDTLEAAQLTLTASLPDPLNILSGTIQLEAKNFKHPEFVLDAIALETELNSHQSMWPIGLRAEGNFGKPLAFHLSGSWHWVGNRIEARLTHLDGSLGSYPFKLMDYAALTYEPDAIEAHALHFSIGESEFKSDLTIQHHSIDAHLEGNQIPSEFIQFLSPEMPIKGKASVIADLKGPLEHPTGHARLLLHQVQITEEIFAARPLIEGEIHLELAENGTAIDSIFHGIGKTPVTARGTLPLTLSLSPFRLNTEASLPLHLDLAAEGELDPYLNLFYNDITNLSGQAKIALTIQGSLKTPQIQGEIDLYNGAYESLSTGAIYKNIQARLEGDGSRLVLKHFSAHDNKQGAITGHGTVTLDSSAGFPFEFQIQPTQIFIVDSDYATISASGSLWLIGNQHQSKLQGSLKADQAIIKMEEALPTQVKSVEVKYVNLPEGTSPPHHQSQEAHWPLQLDVNLEFPSQVVIEGKNLKSEWKGAIHITGTPSTPLLNGELRVSNGQYNFNGKIFHLTQGSIHFGGSPSKKTTLYVVASKEIDRIRAEIIVKGPASKLGISFRSNPPLSQREVLSYILFNRGISDITPDQGDVLSQSFTELNSDSGQGQNHTDFLSRLRNNIGIDRLDLTSSDSQNQDLALQVGRYISDGVYVSYNKSINAGYDRVAIEANIRKNLKAQAEVGVGDTAQGKLMLKWKKDY